MDKVDKNTSPVKKPKLNKIKDIDLFVHDIVEKSRIDLAGISKLQGKFKNVNLFEKVIFRKGINLDKDINLSSKYKLVKEKLIPSVKLKDFDDIQTIMEDEKPMEKSHNITQWKKTFHTFKKINRSKYNAFEELNLNSKYSFKRKNNPKKINNSQFKLEPFIKLVNKNSQQQFERKASDGNTGKDKIISNLDYNLQKSVSKNIKSTDNTNNSRLRNFNDSKLNFKSMSTKSLNDGVGWNRSINNFKANKSQYKSNNNLSNSSLNETNRLTAKRHTLKKILFSEIQNLPMAKTASETIEEREYTNYKELYKLSLLNTQDIGNVSKTDRNTNGKKTLLGSIYDDYVKSMDPKSVVEFNTISTGRKSVFNENSFYNDKINLTIERENKQKGVFLPLINRKGKHVLDLIRKENSNKVSKKLEINYNHLIEVSEKINSVVNQALNSISKQGIHKKDKAK